MAEEKKEKGKRERDGRGDKEKEERKKASRGLEGGEEEEATDRSGGQ